MESKKSKEQSFRSMREVILRVDKLLVLMGRYRKEVFRHVVFQTSFLVPFLRKLLGEEATGGTTIICPTVRG